MGKWVHTYARILKIGTDKSLPSDKVLRIKIVNGISAVGALAMLITTITITILSVSSGFSARSLSNFYENVKLFSIPDARGYLVFIFGDLIATIIFVSTLYLNYRRKHNWAIFNICASSILIVGLYYWVKGGLLVFYFFIPVMLSVVLYDKRSRYLPLVIVNLAIMVLLTIVLYKNNWLFRTPYPDTPKLFAFILNFFIAFLIVFIIAYHFQAETNKSRKSLYHKNILFELQSEEITAQRDAIRMHKEELESKNTRITDSIKYAKNIQTALLPRMELLDQILPEHFILLRPRDIVSGDFYWFSYIEDLAIIAAVDCTGHGIPGAFMSMLGSAYLNEIVNKEYITHPAVILRRLRKEVIRSLHQEEDNCESKDGMDIALCVIDREKMKLQFAGATNSMYLVRHKDAPHVESFRKTEHGDHILFEIKGDRQSISVDFSDRSFTMHEIDYQEGDSVYLFSDGYADQFGGPDGKKFGYGNFRHQLLKNCTEEMGVQKTMLEECIDNWKGDFSQVDDIIVVGVKL